MRHEYENGEAKEVMVFREPEMATFLEVMASEEHSQMEFNATEIGRQFAELTDTPERAAAWAKLSKKKRLDRCEKMLGDSSPEDHRAMVVKNQAGLAETLDLLEAVEIDGEPVKVKSLMEFVMKDPIRKIHLRVARNKLFKEDGD